jgi:putative hemolysin
LEANPPLSAILTSAWNLHFYPITPGLVIGVIVILILLLISALVSGAEVAYFSLSPQEKLKIKKSKTRANKTIVKNLENPEKLLATILVSNNFVNIGIVILTTYEFSNLVDFSGSPVLGFLVQVVFITFFLLLFGEIAPKIYATHYGPGFARFMALPLSFLIKVLNPINSILVYSTSFVNKRLAKHKKNISLTDISQALELTSKHEISEDKGILEGIVKFANKKVAEIMKPRVDVVAIEIKTPFEEVIKIIRESNYSRIPVYSDTFDQVSGILYIKDLLPHLHKGKAFKWQSTIRPPYYIPETKQINSLLEEFRKRKVHMAVVVDEYGGSSGIVTMEDILEEIVGEIVDEFDVEEKSFTKIAENQYLFDGKILLVDFYKVAGLPETVFDEIKGEADTLAGLILELKGEFPLLHDRIPYKNFVFTIEALNKRRIQQIKVEIK